jgi:hypothetical protein
MIVSTLPVVGNRYLEPPTTVGGLLFLGGGVPLPIALGRAENRVAVRWESYAV